jgi:hypothetical protein
MASQKTKVDVLDSQSTFHADVDVDLIDGMFPTSFRRLFVRRPNVGTERRWVESDGKNFLVQRIDRTKDEFVERRH